MSMKENQTPTTFLWECASKTQKVWLLYIGPTWCAGIQSTSSTEYQVLFNWLWQTFNRELKILGTGQCVQVLQTEIRCPHLLGKHQVNKKKRQWQILSRRVHTTRPPVRNGSLGSRKDIHPGPLPTLLGEAHGEDGKKGDHHRRLLLRRGLVGAHTNKRSKEKIKQNIKRRQIKRLKKTRDKKIKSRSTKKDKSRTKERQIKEQRMRVSCWMQWLRS